MKPKIIGPKIYPVKKNSKVVHKAGTNNLDKEMAFLTQYSDGGILSDSSSIYSLSPFGKRSSGNTFGGPNMKPIQLFTNTDTDKMPTIQVDSTAPFNYVDISDIDNKKGDDSEETIKVLNKNLKIIQNNQR